MKGLIFNIKRYAIHDGPGIRVTFFMKGCPLSCCWCHNPEGISQEPETVVQVDRIGEKEFRKTEIAGKWYTAEDILKVLDREKIFIRESSGGVTFSGGEPMMQTDFLSEALKACRENGYHTAVDTSGNSMAENFNRIIPFTDLFLFDIKHMNDDLHLKYTGVSNSLILSNLRLVLQSGRDVFIRIPVIPGFNDDYENLDRLKKLLAGSKYPNLRKISLLPYHRIGKAKYQKFNIPYRMNGTEPPSRERMNELKKYFEETGIKTCIGG